LTGKIEAKLKSVVSHKLAIVIYERLVDHPDGRTGNAVVDLGTKGSVSPSSQCRKDQEFRNAHHPRRGYQRGRVKITSDRLSAFAGHERSERPSYSQVASIADQRFAVA
jgi:hypothetical protein